MQYFFFDYLPAPSCRSDFSGDCARPHKICAERCATLGGINLEHHMSDVERTPAGLQMIIPGCERRTLPRSTTRVDDAGQGLLGFCRAPSMREQLATRAAAPLRPSKG